MNTQKEIKYCRNCFHRMQHDADYCEQCGQKYTTGKVTFRELFAELIEAVFNIDSKIFRTVRTLFIPGRLTNDYFAGKHKRYLHPVRLFFVTAIIFLALLTILVFRSTDNDLDKLNRALTEGAYKSSFMDDLDAAKDSVKLLFPRQDQLVQAMDSLNRYLGDPRQDSTNINYYNFSMNDGLEYNKLRIPEREMVELSIDSIFRKYEIEGFVAQTMARQNIKLDTELGNFVRYLMGQLIWMIAIMMPILALLLKLLYIRRKHYYIEHLIFSFHYHAFAFITTAALLFLFLFPWEGVNEDLFYMTLPGILGIAIMIYQFVAMRRVYKQGWIKTFFKFSFLNFCYIFIFIGAAVVVTAISAAVY